MFLQKYEDAFADNKKKLMEAGFEVETRVLAGILAEKSKRLPPPKGIHLLSRGQESIIRRRILQHPCKRPHALSIHAPSDNE